MKPPWRICLGVLVGSWIYTLSEYYIPIGIEQTNIYEIYTLQGVPFALILISILNYSSKKKKDSNSKIT